MSKVFTVEASVHKPIGEGYRVKVSVLDLGMYINGMMVFPPNAEHEDWAVYPPAQRAGRGKFAYIVEFNKKMPLWDEIHIACIEAVQYELSLDSGDPSDGVVKRSDFLDKVVEDIPDEPINLDDIEF